MIPEFLARARRYGQVFLYYSDSLQPAPTSLDYEVMKSSYLDVFWTTGKKLLMSERRIKCIYEWKPYIFLIRWTDTLYV
jgi:hypothetical protein